MRKNGRFEHCSLSLRESALPRHRFHLLNYTMTGLGKTNVPHDDEFLRLSALSRSERLQNGAKGYPLRYAF